MQCKFYDSNLRYWAFTFHDFDYCHPVQKSDCHPTQNVIAFPVDCEAWLPSDSPTSSRVYYGPATPQCSTDWWRPKTSLGIQPLPSSHTRLTPLIRSEWFCKITKFGDFCFDNETICQGEWFDCDHGSWWLLTFTWKISLWPSHYPRGEPAATPAPLIKLEKTSRIKCLWINWDPAKQG